jgi:hypothetical protein
MRERVLKERIRILVVEEKNRRELQVEASKDSIHHRSQVGNGIVKGVRMLTKKAMHVPSRRDQKRETRVNIIVVHDDDKEEEEKRIAFDLLKAAPPVANATNDDNDAFDLNSAGTSKKWKSEKPAAKANRRKPNHETLTSN